METKWILTAFVLVCALIGAGAIITSSMDNKPVPAHQGSVPGFVLEKELPVSGATAPVYRVISKESVFQGSPDVMTVKRSIPSEEQAVPLAEKILRDYGGLPEDAVLLKVEQIFLEKSNGETKDVGEKFPQFTQVIYEQQIQGSPVVGPGAEINICLGENGELLQIEKAWRHVEYGGEVPIISASEAYEKLRSLDLLIVPQSQIAGVRISDVKLGYYAEHRDHDQNIYSPVWIFYGYKQGGKPFPYMVDARQK